jgi:hypothetical protein
LEEKAASMICTGGKQTSRWWYRYRYKEDKYENWNCEQSNRNKENCERM